MDEQLDERQKVNADEIYVQDKGVEKRIEELVKSKECIQLIERAKSAGGVLQVLDDMLPDLRPHSLSKFLSHLHPFYQRAEYRTREDYLQYLKQAYGFMLTPLEVPPGKMVGLFFPHYKKNWSPSRDSAQELLKKFYVEIELISDLSPSEWEEVASASNPEAVLVRLLYKMKFTSDFEDFLRRIPWIVAEDVYSAPGLDLIYRRAPGHVMPKKPFGVGENFIKKLVQSSLNEQTYTVLASGQEKIALRKKTQIIDMIGSEGEVHMDSFIGVSKIERDFVIHQHIVIWNNPGFERFQKSTFLERLVFARPPEFLAAIREEAIPLEIPFIKKRSHIARR